MMAEMTFDNNGLAEASGMVTVYNFDAESREYTGASDEYIAVGVGLPASACTTAPNTAPSGYVMIWQDGGWLCVPDHRGETVYSVTDGSAFLISEPGEYPVDITTLAPATAFDVWSGEKWITDSGKLKAAETEAADQYKKDLLATAQKTISVWQTKLLLNRISENEKDSLNAWLDYIDAVQAVDTGTAPEVSWPSVPE